MWHNIISKSISGTKVGGINMITVKKKATIATISELRNKSSKILNSLKENRVILQRHKKPVAIMVDYKQYENVEEMLEFAEDYILGMTALQRDKKAKKRDFVDIDEW